MIHTKGWDGRELLGKVQVSVTPLITVTAIHGLLWQGILLFISHLLDHGWHQLKKEGREKRENWKNLIGLGTCLDHAQSTNQILSRWCNDYFRNTIQDPQTAMPSPYPSNKYWQEEHWVSSYLLFLLFICLEVRVVTGELLCDWGYLGGLTH